MNYLKKMNYPIKHQETQSQIIPKQNIPLQNKVILRKKFTRPISRGIIPQQIFKKKPIQKGDLNIPEPQLPERLRYIRPTPSEASIDLKKLNILMRDNAVRVIECPGPDERIIVKGAMGTKPTSIRLREDEIKEILEEFSNKSKIPIHEGIYRVAIGRIILSAIISSVIPTKFIIEKMRYPPLRNPSRMSKNA